MKMERFRRKRRHCVVAWAISAFATASLSGCASGPHVHRDDPLEPLNRSVYRFNDGVDRAVLKPVATVYRDTIPSPVRTGIGNFFRNLGDVWSAANSALQFKLQDAVENGMRFGVNTVFGLGGILDVASEMNIERHREDFGKTLAHWGVSTGPYLVLPILGPSTVRDALSIPVDTRGNLLMSIDHVPTRNSLYGAQVVETRSELLRASALLDDAALDPYTFVRDAYLQLRRPSRDLVDDEDYSAQPPQGIVAPQEKPGPQPVPAQGR